MKTKPRFLLRYFQVSQREDPLSVADLGIKKLRNGESLGTWLDRQLMVDQIRFCYHVEHILAMRNEAFFDIIVWRILYFEDLLCLVQNIVAKQVALIVSCSFNWRIQKVILVACPGC